MSTLPEIGFALVGTGSIARMHAAAIAAVPRARLRAVYSRTAASAAAFAREFGAETADTLDALLARPDVHAVCVTVPSGTHGEITARALAAGKHVLCEKPLEISAARIDAMVAAAERAQRILAAVFQLRLGHGAGLLQQAVAAGRFGKLTLCSAYVKWWRNPDYYKSSSWKGTAEQDGGGALMNQAIHGVDLLQWIAGKPVRVSAQTRTRTHPIAMEDTAAAVLEYAHGAVGVIEAATSCFPGTAMRLEIAGDQGFAVLENDRITHWQFAVPHPDDDAIRAGRASVLVGGSSDPKAIGIEGHRRLVADLVDAIRTGRAPAIPSREGRHAVAIIEAIYRSAKNGGAPEPVS